MTQQISQASGTFDEVPSPRLTRAHWKALLELGRVSNLPTVVSNVTVGFFLGGGNLGSDSTLWLGTIGITACLYEGGMFLNDLFDYRIDRLERPQRPIPSGRVSLTEASVLAILLFSTGLLGALLVLPNLVPLVLGLTILIFLYNRVHTQFVLSPLLMGSCRGCVYLLGAMAGGWKAPGPFIYGMAGALTLYVSAVSFIARNEIKNTATQIQTAIHSVNSLLLVGALLLPFLLPGEGPILFFIALVVAFFWLARTASLLLRKKIIPMAAVGRILAGMSLFDAVVLAKLQTVPGVFIAWVCFLGARLWQKSIRPT